ncbi:MAG TPA: hypothetical protein VFQ44_00620 [Streptosporangiaceae bacterium]|nr:hypothetical protein [Streptosporangiaceae bacterium]
MSGAHRRLPGKPVRPAVVVAVGMLVALVASASMWQRAARH